MPPHVGEDDDWAGRGHGQFGSKGRVCEYGRMRCVWGCEKAAPCPSQVAIVVPHAFGGSADPTCWECLVSRRLTHRLGELRPKRLRLESQPATCAHGARMFPERPTGVPKCGRMTYLAGGPAALESQSVTWAHGAHMFPERPNAGV